MKIRSALVPFAFTFAASCGGRPVVTGAPSGAKSGSHVIEIDIDDHGLAGLWMANAPNLKGLIGRGVLAYSRVDLPTHSNQNNMTLLTGQYPEGHSVPSNEWLSRSKGFASPLGIGGISIGDYALYAVNPLLRRGDSVYRAVRAVGGLSAFVGELPPFEAGADDVHLSLVGTMANTPLGPLTLDATATKNLLTSALGYPLAVVDAYDYDGPPAPGESQLHFTLRDAAKLVRATSAAHPMPELLFVWDFIALDNDPTSTFGADGAHLAAVIEDYDAGIGELLDALTEKGLLDSTNILFTLDHGKVDTHNQVALGTRGTSAAGEADGQLAAVVKAHPELGVTPSSYALLNEDGDALLYARVRDAGTLAGAVAQTEMAHRLVALVQTGNLVGVDVTRTMTADGFLGTRTFHDARVSGPNQADVIIFPKDDWTLNQVDLANAQPGPFLEHTKYPYARHGGFSVDELYVPLIMAGPAFKRAALLPHPVEHADVAPTALAALVPTAGSPRVALATAARGPIHAAFANDPGETIALPEAPETSRDVVLTASGFLGTRLSPASPASSVVLIDVAGLYDEEVFGDPATDAAAAPLRAIAAKGTRFEDCWTRSRDWPVTEYQMLTGGYPVSPWRPAAEDDPAQTVAPGAGLLLMPPVAGHVANAEAYGAWRAHEPFAQPSLFSVVATLGLSEAFFGDPDFHELHLSEAVVLVRSARGSASVADDVAAFAAIHPKFFGVVALGGARTADRHSAAALDELAALARAVSDVVAAAPNALVVITSRGATPIDDPGADFYGAGTSRHVPLVLVGPGVRVGVVSGQPATPADVPATILWALGVPSTTDFVQGTWATGTPTPTLTGGIPQPLPAAATEGHALLRAF